MLQNVTVDALNATSILSTLTANSTGFIPVANSLLVALGQNKSDEVEAAIKNLVNNSTGNASYPATPLSQNVTPHHNKYALSTCIQLARCS